MFTLQLDTQDTHAATQQDSEVPCIICLYIPVGTCCSAHTRRYPEHSARSFWRFLPKRYQYLL